MEKRRPSFDFLLSSGSRFERNRRLESIHRTINEFSISETRPIKPSKLPELKSILNPIAVRRSSSRELDWVRKIFSGSNQFKKRSKCKQQSLKLPQFPTRRRSRSRLNEELEISKRIKENRAQFLNELLNEKSRNLGGTGRKNINTAHKEHKYCSSKMRPFAVDGRKVFGKPPKVAKNGDEAAVTTDLFLNERTLKQRQFAEELVARLARLAHETRAGSYSEDSDGDTTPSRPYSRTSSGLQPQGYGYNKNAGDYLDATSRVKLGRPHLMPVVPRRINSPSASTDSLGQLQPAEENTSKCPERLEAKSPGEMSDDPPRDTTLPHSNVKDRPKPSNSQNTDMPPMLTQSRLCSSAKESFDNMCTVVRCQSENRIFSEDECDIMDELDLIKKEVNTRTKHRRNELDCLEDDKPSFEEVESLLDASDSEVSGDDQQHHGSEDKLFPVIASLFPNTPSVLRFVYDNQSVFQLPKAFKGKLRWRSSAITPNVVKRSLKRSHFKLTLKYPDWLGYFGNHLRPTGFRPIKEFQKVNHFPGSFQIGRKDKLWLNLSRIRTKFGRKVIDFVPRTFCLPSDMRMLREVWGRFETSNGDCNSMIGNPGRPRWILKPPASARGIGIRVIRNWSEVPKQRHMVVQAYVSRPYLINETKFDLRLYVYVTCFNPFRAYLHREGLVRFASQKYSTSITEISNRFVHLTNYSVNKHNRDEETGVKNHKWKLETLWTYLAARHVNVNGLWMRLKDIIFKTLASVTSSISLMVDQNCRRRGCVHELFGFDVLLDADLKPWLLEVNVSPSLHTNTVLDNEVKSAVVTDMFNIAGFRLPPDYRSPAYDRVFRDDSSFNSNDAASDTGCPSLPRQLTSYSRSLVQDVNQVHGPVNFESVPTRTGQTKNMTSPPKTPVNPYLSDSNRSSTFVGSFLKFGVDPFVPLSDPRLWDMALTWDERQKHIYHSRLIFNDELLNKQKVRGYKNLAAELRVNRLARPTVASSMTQKSVNRPKANSATPSNLCLMEELRSLLAHLTPDDVRTLVDFVDERYRASLGNFETVFPIGGERGLELLLFLEGCNFDTHSGNLGVRTPALRYYDLLLYAYLTVYQNGREMPSSYEKMPLLDYVAASQLPDYQLLLNGEMSKESLAEAASMTGVNTEGLSRLMELCKRGFHVLGSDTSVQRMRWNQSATPQSSPYKVRQTVLYGKGAPTEVCVGQFKIGPGAANANTTTASSSPQMRGQQHLSANGDAVQTILGGAVSFRAQSPQSGFPADFESKTITSEICERTSKAVARSSMKLQLESSRQGSFTNYMRSVNRRINPMFYGGRKTVRSHVSRSSTRSQSVTSNSSIVSRSQVSEDFCLSSNRTRSVQTCTLASQSSKTYEQNSDLQSLYSRRTQSIPDLPATEVNTLTTQTLNKTKNPSRMQTKSLRGATRFKRGRPSLQAVGGTEYKMLPRCRSRQDSSNRYDERNDFQRKYRRQWFLDDSTVCTGGINSTGGSAGLVVRGLSSCNSHRPATAYGDSSSINEPL